MAQPADATTPRDLPQPRVSTLPFPVVGLGASAGGMAAAVELFTHMPDLPGMAFVLVLHLSPEHESHAAEILQRVTRMRVVQVTETMAIQPDHLYVIAPALNLTMDDGQLVVQPPQPSRGRPVAIDLFFRTLAQAHRERAVAVVLSGTGADGTLGLGEIKAEGGVTIAQAPADAEYDGMPSAAVASGRVDFVLRATEIAAKLVDLWQNARCIELPDPADCDPRASNQDGASSEARAAAALSDVLEILSARTGNEFRHYKRGTVLRRLERRMQVTRQPTLPAYRDYLDRYPQESEQLLQDMLISVTSFFRDREAFESLGRELAASLATRRPAPAQLRAWVVGCATGEEGYSLAMLLHDHVPSAMPRIGIQVFASDIDDRALAVARGGAYPETIRADVSATRLAQFFETDAGSYRVKKGLREQILFTRHNVLRDPPFSRLDLITCRNLLIYLERDVQARVLEVFHFALNPGGLLMLGSAESADLLTDLFSVVDKKQRIYRANPVRPVHRELLPQIVPMASLELLSRSAHHDITSLAQIHQRLRNEHDSASIVLDLHGNLVHASAGASRYLRHVEGVPSQNLLELVLPDLASALRPALFLARRSGQRVAAKPVTITGEQGTITLQMTIRGQQSTGHSTHLLILFDEVDTSLAEQADVAPDGRSTAYRALEDEVARLQSQLQGTIGDSAASGEALRASNEELQSINEELRSATEELETSKEELQSVNEELTTVNFELKHKVEETAKVNDDLNNLIASMNIATIFVDRRLHIKGFTPLASRVFNVLSTDIGRPLGDLTHRLHYDQVTQDVSHVLSTLQPAEQEISSGDGRWYLMRVSAYRTNEDRIDGAVLNFIDVTERRAAQEQLRARDERLRLVAESTKDYAVITLDAQGSVTGWNKGAQLMFGYVESEMLGEHFRRLFVPEDRATGAPEQELRAARDVGRALDERWHLRKDGSRFYCSGITTPLLEAGVDGFAKIARDLTERRLLEREREELLQAEKDVRQQLEAAHALRGQFLAVMSHELKNPLNLVMLNTELLARSPEVVGDPRLARATDTIRRAVQGQAQIIDDLLDLSRLNTGKLSLSRTGVQWHAVIERIADAQRLRRVHAIRGQHRAERIAADRQHGLEQLEPDGAFRPDDAQRVHGRRMPAIRRGRFVGHPLIAGLLAATGRVVSAHDRHLDADRPPARALDRAAWFGGLRVAERPRPFIHSQPRVGPPQRGVPGERDRIGRRRTRRLRPRGLGPVAHGREPADRADHAGRVDADVQHDRQCRGDTAGGDVPVREQRPRRVCRVVRLVDRPARDMAAVGGTAFRRHRVCPGSRAARLGRRRHPRQRRRVFRHVRRRRRRCDRMPPDPALKFSAPGRVQTEQRRCGEASSAPAPIAAAIRRLRGLDTVPGRWRVRCRYHPTGPGHRLTPTCWTCGYSRSPYTPSSRPWPLILPPPQGASRDPAHQREFAVHMRVCLFALASHLLIQR